MAYASGIHQISSAALFTVAHRAMAAPPQLDHLMLFGFLSAFVAATCYIYRHESRGKMLTMAASMAGASAYGFLQGAWPLGILGAAIAFDAVRQGLQMNPARPIRRRRFGSGGLPIINLEARHARFREVFGSN